MDYKPFVLKMFLGFFLFITFFSIPVSASSVGLIENSTWQQNLTAIRFGSLAFGDIDNDSDLDLVSTGCLSAGALRCDAGVIAKIYINNGTTLTENSTWEQNLTALGLSSISLGDINNDGKLDLVISGCDAASDPDLCTGNIIIKIYINNGTTLTENSTWEQNLTAIGPGSLALGDINNDGKLDLVLKGISASTFVSKIYINNGTTLTENSTWEQSLTALGRSHSISLVDINNDGYLDLDLNGWDGSLDYNKIYINNGTTLTENSTWEQSLTGWGWSANIFGDYDNDGDLDLVRSGTLTGDHLYIFKNNGSTFVLNQTSVGDGGDDLIGLFQASLAFGDYDNDGDLDLIAMGRDMEAGRDRVYEQNITHFFKVDARAQANITIDTNDGSLAQIDVDNDGDLDLVMIGSSTSLGLLAKIYLNNITTPNTAPSPPTSFSSSYANGRLALSWGSGSDTETPSSGLYYNLRVGTCSGCNDIVSGVYGGSSNPTAGYFGNMMQRRSISLAVPSRTYYWSVQAIDTGLAKSGWSAEQIVTTTTTTTTATTTSTTTSTNITTTTTAGAGGGGGGGGGGAGAPQANVTVNATRSEASITMNVTGGESSITISREANTGVTEIRMTVSNPANDVRITVTKLEEKPAAIAQELAGKVYHYLEINKTNIQDKDIDRINITFTVNKSWIKENDIDAATIALYRYSNDTWNKLQTNKVNETSDQYYFQAISPGFSVFAIAGEKSKEFPWMPVIAVIAAVVAVVLLYFFWPAKEKRAPPL